MQVGNKFFLLIGFVVAFVVFSVFSLFFVLGVGYGVVVCFLVWPMYEKWLVDRKKKDLARKRVELRKLEDEVYGARS